MKLHGMLIGNKAKLICQCNETMQRKEILFCNLTILKNNKEEVLERVVYKDIDGHYKKNKVLKVEVICSLGFENEQEPK